MPDSTQTLPGQWPNVSMSSPAGLIQGQALANIWGAGFQGQMNRPNEVGPFGSVTWSYDPNTGQLVRNWNVAPNQGMLNAQREEQDIILGGLASDLAKQGFFNQPFDYSGIAPVQDFSMSGAPNAQWGGYSLGTMPQADAKERQRIEKNLYDTYSARMQPQFDQDRSKLTQQLADQGLVPGSALYERELERLDRQQKDSLANLSAQATQFGGDEMSSLYNMALAGRQQQQGEQQQSWENLFTNRQQYQNEAQAAFDNSLAGRQQAIGEYSQQYYAPFQNYSYLTGAQRGFQMPQAQQYGQISVPGIDVGGIGTSFAQMANQLKLAEANGVEQLGSDYLSSLFGMGLPSGYLGSASTAGSNPYIQFGSQFANALLGAYGSPR